MSGAPLVFGFGRAGGHGPHQIDFWYCPRCGAAILGNDGAHRDKLADVHRRWHHTIDTKGTTP